MRRILHVDMDAFFAAIELKRHPELAGKPLVIGGDGDPHSRGVVSTASYEARRYGIHSAMPLRTAHRLCPQAVFLPVDFREYERVAQIVKRILARHSATLEDSGIDEAWLDVSDSALRAEEIARAIKRDIASATGLTCSIGIGPNKLLAKIASARRTAAGCTRRRTASTSARSSRSGSPSRAATKSPSSATSATGRRSPTRSCASRSGWRASCRRTIAPARR